MSNCNCPLAAENHIPELFLIILNYIVIFSASYKLEKCDFYIDIQYILFLV